MAFGVGQRDNKGGFAGPRVGGDVFVAFEIALGDEASVAPSLSHVVDVGGAHFGADIIGGGFNSFIFVATIFVG